MQEPYREPYEEQEAYDLANDKKADKLPCCCKCGEAIWEETAVYYDGKFVCWECESDLWQEIRKDYLRSTYE